MEGMVGTNKNKIKRARIRVGSAFRYSANPPHTPKNFLLV